MSEVKMFSEPVPNVPWQDRPANDNHDAPIWRYTENPIIGRNPAKGVARIFNSAVVPFEGKFVGVFRGEQVNGIPYIYLGESEDAIHWNISEEKIKFVDENGEEFMPIYAYDPRLVKVEDTYYAIWCQDFYVAAIGIAKSKDLKTFVRIENPFLPFNRNAVLFPRKINGNFVMLSRPSDSGHTPFGDIFVSESPDMVYWVSTDMSWARAASGGSHSRLAAVQPLSRLLKDGCYSTTEYQERVMVMYTQSVEQSLISTTHRSLSIVVRTSFSHQKSGTRSVDLFLMYASHVLLFTTASLERSPFTTVQLTAMWVLHSQSLMRS